MIYQKEGRRLSVVGLVYNLYHMSQHLQTMYSLDTQPLLNKNITKRKENTNNSYYHVVRVYVQRYVIEERLFHHERNELMLHSHI